MRSGAAAWLLLASAACQPKALEPQEKLLYYPDGAVLRRYTTLGDKIEGGMTDYYPDGQVKFERFFQNGAQAGRQIVYYPGGKVKEVQYFVDGLKQGGDTLWYENGQPQFAVSFRDGKMDGYMRKWTPEGELFFEARYVMDSLAEVRRSQALLDSLGFDLQDRNGE